MSLILEIDVDVDAVKLDFLVPVHGNEKEKSNLFHNFLKKNSPVNVKAVDQQIKILLLSTIYLEKRTSYSLSSQEAGSIEFCCSSF